MRNQEWDSGGRIETPVTAGGGEQAPRSPDLIFDFSGLGRMTAADLALLVTAQQLADEEDRTVWVAGLPSSTWGTLRAMGLGHLFRPFPLTEERRA